MKNNGFTLIELIVTISLILILFVVAVPASTTLIQNSNRKHCKNEVNDILTNAELYVLDHPNDYKNAFVTKELDLVTLYDKGYIDELYDFKNGYVLNKGILYKDDIAEDLKVIITKMKDGSAVTNATTNGYNKYELNKDICGSGGIATSTCEEDSDFDYVYEDFNSDSNVSKPRLDYLDTATNYLIPVVYDETCNDEYGCWRKANTCRTWYDYSDGAWANVIRVNENKSTCNVGSNECYDAITKRDGEEYLSAPEGTEISEDDIQEMLVWIPKFDYKIEGTYEEGVIPSEISIQFNSNISDYKEGNAKTEWYTHPAFKKEIITQNGDEINYELKDIAGFWVQKFEGTGAPNYVRDRTHYNQVDTYTKGGISAFQTIYNDKMINNFEWAAIAYLSQSDYGFINRCSEILPTIFHTNVSPGTIGFSSPGDQKSSSSITGVTNLSSNWHTYNGNTIAADTFENIKSNYTQQKSSTKTYCGSTTGTIYGVYDMVGGLPEYVFVTMNDSDTEHNITPFFHAYGTDSGYFGASLAVGNCRNAEAINNYISNFCTGENYNNETCYENAIKDLNTYSSLRYNYTKYHSYSFSENAFNREDYKKGDATYEIFGKEGLTFLYCDDHLDLVVMGSASLGNSYWINRGAYVTLTRGTSNIFDFIVGEGYFDQAVTTRLTYSNIGN